MTLTTGLMSSNTYEWATPQDFFDMINREFHFTLDVCASEWNHKTEHYFSTADDGLRQTWSGTVWMNPPYGKDIAAWMAKAVEYWRGGGDCGVSSTSTN